MAHRSKFRPTTLADRARFVWLWKGGLSARAIAEENGTSVTTVCRWITRWNREGHVNTKPRSGRPRLKTGRSVELGQEASVSAADGDHSFQIFCRSSEPSYDYHDVERYHWPPSEASNSNLYDMNPIYRSTFQYSRESSAFKKPTGINLGESLCPKNNEKFYCSCASAPQEQYGRHALYNSP